MRGCRFCERLADKVKPQTVWVAEHADHGGLSIQQADHPSGEWVWLVCVCGKMYLTMKESAEKIVKDSGERRMGE